MPDLETGVPLLIQMRRTPVVARSDKFCDMAVNHLPYSSPVGSLPTVVESSKSSTQLISKRPSSCEDP